MAEGEEEVAVPLALSESQKKLIKESVSEKPVHFLGLPLRHSPPPDDTIHVLSVCEPAHNLINDEEASECLQGRHVFSSQTLDEEFIEDSMPMTHISPEREFNSSENEHNESLNYTLEGSPDGSKRSMQREKVHKTENAAGRRLFSRAAGAILNQHAKLPRTTVWDRLGRVSEPRDCVKVNVSGAKNNEIIDNNKFLQSLEDPKYCSRLSENSDIKLEGSAFDRKRQFNDLNPHSAGIYYSAADEGSCQYRGLLSEKDNKALFENALSFQAGRLKSQNYGSTFDVSTSSRSIKIPQEKLTAGSLDYVEGPISFVVPQAAKQTSKGDGDVATGGIKPMQAQLMGMKLRLHQMETEILNLQENIKDQNQGLLFSSSNRSKGT